MHVCGSGSGPVMEILWIVLDVLVAHLFGNLDIRHLPGTFVR